MALKEEFELHGNLLFRYRSYMPVIIILFFPFVIVSYTPHVKENILQYWRIICFFISFLGLGIRIVTIGFVPHGTSGRNTKRQIAETLNTKSMYSIVRHPLYMGNFVIVFGIVLSTMIWWFVLLVNLLFWIYYERIMFAEEEFLRKKFRATYEKWAQLTPAFIPDIRKWKSPDLPFSLRFAIKREFTGLFGIVVLFTFIDFLMNCLSERKLDLINFWTFLFLFGFLSYITLLIIVKKTKILDVGDRKIQPTPYK